MLWTYNHEPLIWLLEITLSQELALVAWSLSSVKHGQLPYGIHYLCEYLTVRTTGTTLVQRENNR